MLSRKVTEYAVPEVLVRTATDEDVGDSLPSLPTLTARAGDAWYSPVEEKVVKSDLLGP